MGRRGPPGCPPRPCTRRSSPSVAARALPTRADPSAPGVAGLLTNGSASHLVGSFCYLPFECSSSEAAGHLDEHLERALLLGQETDHLLVVVEPLDGMGQQPCQPARVVCLCQSHVLHIAPFRPRSRRTNVATRPRVPAPTTAARCGRQTLRRQGLPLATMLSFYSSIVANRLLRDSASVGWAKMASRRTV